MMALQVLECGVVPVQSSRFDRVVEEVNGHLDKRRDDGWLGLKVTWRTGTNAGLMHVFYVVEGYREPDKTR